MKSIVKTGLCALLATMAIQGQAQTKVKVLSLTETRKVKADTGKKKRFGSFGAGADSGVELEVELKGPIVVNAIKFGNVKVTAAADDKGTDLTVEKKKGFMSNNLKEINRKFMYFNEDEVPKDRLKVKIKFGLPARAATSIKLLRGSVDLLIGTKVPVAFPWGTLKKGLKLSNPILKKAGVTFEITEISAKAIKIKATGTLDSIAEVEVYGPKKKDLTSGGGWSGWGTTRNYNLDATSTFTSTAKLTITILAGKKTVSVPISLKNLKLK